MDENIRFAPNAVVDCVGDPILREDKEVGTIIGYEIVDGQLILEYETHDAETIKALRANGSL